MISIIKCEKVKKHVISENLTVQELSWFTLTGIIVLIYTV